jgi:integrase
MHLHRASGRAVVRLNGRDHYLGPWKSQEAAAAYHRKIAEYLAAGDVVFAERDPAEVVTMDDLAARFWTHVCAYYRKPDGRPTSEPSNFRLALRYALDLYADLPVARFGPTAFLAVRETMLRATVMRRDPATDESRPVPLARGTVNGYMARVRQMVRWGVERELVAPSVWHGLAAVRGIARGRGGRETPRRRDVPAADVEAIAPHVSRQVWAMVALQWLTGMRPGEAVALRTADVQAAGDVWIYEPREHKAEHHGRERRIALGPEARRALAPWLRPGDPDTPVFRPDEAEAARLAGIKAARIAAGGGSGGNRKRPAAHPQRTPGDRYAVDAYRRAIQRACDAAGVPRWSPHQLRHAFATRALAEARLEDVRAALGHARTQTTLVYAHGDDARAAAVARRLG